MTDRRARFLDGFIWPAVIVGDAFFLLIYVAIGFLVVQRFHGGHSGLVVVGAAFGAAYVAAAIPGALLGTRIGFRNAALAGCGMLAVASFLISFAPALAALAACSALLGIGGGAMWPNIEAELARGRQGPSLRRRLTVFNIPWSIGTLVGPVLSGLLYPPEAVVYGEAGREAVNRVFVIASGLAALMFLLLAAWRVRIPPREEVLTEAAGEEPHDPQRLKAFLRMSYVVNMMCYLVISVLRQLYEALADHHWHGRGPAQIHSGLLVVLASAATVTFAGLYVAHRWPYRLRLFVLAQGLMVAGLVLIAGSASIPVAGIGFAMVGAAASFFYSGSLYYSIEGREESQHLTGWHETVIGVGKLGGVLLGLAPSVIGRLGVFPPGLLVRSPYISVAVIFTAACLVQLAIYARFRPRFLSSGRGARP